MTDAELNDRLLELAGGCRHEWTHSLDDGIIRYRCEKRCGERFYWSREKPIPPTVGDGHQVSPGEAIQLWATLAGRGAYVHMVDWDGWQVAIGVGNVEKGYNTDLSLEACITTAIVAAVDGGPK